MTNSAGENNATIVHVNVQLLKKYQYFAYYLLQMTSVSFLSAGVQSNTPKSASATVPHRWLERRSEKDARPPPEYSGYGSYSRTIKRAEPLKRNPP